MYSLLLALPMLFGTAESVKQSPPAKPRTTVVVGISLPDKVQGEVGTFVKVPATTDGAVVKWYALDSGLNLFPVDLLKDTKTAVVTASTAGTYRLMAWTVVAGAPSDAATCSVVIGQPGPQPIPPGPEPADPFYQTLKAAWAQEAGATKAADAAQLAALYRQAAATTVNDVGLLTVGDFLTKFKAAVSSLLPATALPKLRPAIGTELNRVLPTTATAPLDASTRTLIAATFNRIAADMEALK